MAIQISGTTVIDNSRNLSNIANATTAATADTYAIRDANGNISAANLTANMQVFTSPGTFTVPPTTTRLKVTVTGGGGNQPPTSPVVGGAGGTGIAVINVTGGTPIPVTVGAAGALSPTAGGNSTFGSFVTGGGAPGGLGGNVTFPSPAPSYQATLSLFGASGGITPPSPTDIEPTGANSYWGGTNQVSAPPPGPGYASRGSYGAGAGYGGPGPAFAYSYGATAGVVVVEW